MQEEGFRTLEQGGALITASRRLSRALTAEFHERQRSLGRSVWPRPDILPFEAFVDRAWTNLVWQGAEPPGFTLLSPLEEQTVWERVIRDSPAGDSLLDVPDTARGAMEAWRLAHAYDVPVDGRFHATDDASAFLGWARDFESLCGAHLWLDRSRAIDFLAARYAAGDIARPASVYIAGFDDITPQQERFLRTLGDLQRIEAPSHEAEIERRKLVSSDDDIHAAAAWARATLERSPQKRIGVIVPDLRKLRPKVERIFREVLDPVCDLEYGRRAYHVSLGPALDQYPLIYSAFLILEWAEGPLTVPRIGVLLRSPFLAGASQERSSRALLDVKLRKDGAWELDVEQLERSAGSCPELARHLARYRALTRSLPKLQRPSAWSGDFSNLLGALGWPGDRALDSSEHQVSGAWQKLLSDFATLDRTTPPQTLNQALSFLRRTAEATPFQQENTGAPIQVMGLLEASGLEFDCLWILGLDDRSM